MAFLKKKKIGIPNIYQNHSVNYIVVNFIKPSEIINNTLHGKSFLYKQTDSI